MSKPREWDLIVVYHEETNTHHAEAYGPIIDPDVKTRVIEKSYYNEINREKTDWADSAAAWKNRARNLETKLTKAVEAISCVLLDSLDKNPPRRHCPPRHMKVHLQKVLEEINNE